MGWTTDSFSVLSVVQAVGHVHCRGGELQAFRRLRGAGAARDLLRKAASDGLSGNDPPPPGPCLVLFAIPTLSSPPPKKILSPSVSLSLLIAVAFDQEKFAKRHQMMGKIAEREVTDLPILVGVSCGFPVLSRSCPRRSGHRRSSKWSSQRPSCGTPSSRTPKWSTNRLEGTSRKPASK